MSKSRVHVLGCPWCGQQPTVLVDSEEGPYRVTVCCASEYCRARPTVVDEGLRGAVRKWNRRESSQYYVVTPILAPPGA